MSHSNELLQSHAPAPPRRQDGAWQTPWRGTEAVNPAATPLLAALPLVAAILIGGLVVFTEGLALIVCVSLLTCIFILLDFRLGVIALIVLLPLSASALFPHSIGGVIGLNPLNLLLLGTLASCLLHSRSAKALAGVAPKQLFWLYVLPITLAGLLGSSHLQEIPSFMMTSEMLLFKDIGGYLQLMLIKPMLLVLFALLVGAAVAQSLQSQHFIYPMLLSASLMSLMPIVFVLATGAGIAELASERSRQFLSPLGIHANDLGRLYAVAYALMLFTLAETKAYHLKLALVTAMALTITALMLTFSRGAFFGFILVNLWFLLTRRTLANLLMFVALLLALLLALPGGVLERIGFGLDAGANAANAVSAGRIDALWLPLAAELERSPLFGNGLASILWSDTMRTGMITDLSMDRGAMPIHPHNAYLQALLDMGGLGLILLCGYFLHVWKGLRALSQAPALSPEQRGFYTGAGVGLVSFLVAGFAGSSLTPAIEQSFLWLAIGMMYGQQYQFARETKC